MQKTSKSTKQNKWKLLEKFTDWLVDPYQEELDEEVKKVLDHKLLISMFSKIPNLCKFCNRYLCNYSIYQIDIEELAKFMKHLCYIYSVDRRNIWWFANLEPWQSKDLSNRLVLLKKFERNLLTKISDVDYSHYTKTGNRRSSKPKEEAINLKQVLAEFTVMKQEKDCLLCTLNTRPQALFDTNTKTNIKKTEILFVAEAPGEQEAETGVPLVGKAGKLFRRCLATAITRTTQVKWFITNTCLCRPPQNRAPTPDEIKCCWDKLERIIDLTNPKIIVALGGTAAKRFGVNTPITKSRGIHKYKAKNGKEYDVFTTLHPSAIARGAYPKQILEDDISAAITHIKQPDNIEAKKSDQVKIIKLDPEFYEMDLVDIQETKHNILYIFRDKEGKKVYHHEPKYFYYYVKASGKSNPVEKYEDLLLVDNTYPEYKAFTKFGNTYESDISVSTRHLIDFYINKPENNYEPRVLYLDIEVATDGTFPDPSLGQWPISLVTLYTEKDGFICLVNNNQKIKLPNKVDNCVIKRYNNEADMIKALSEFIKSENIDIITAWNISFDMGYIYNRIKTLKLDPGMIAPISNLKDEINIDPDRHKVVIPGLVCIDLLTSYKILTYGNRESYSLDYISRYELGEGKLHKGGLFYQLWKDDPIEAIRYNIDDVDKIVKIDRKLGIIDYFNELRNVSGVSWKDANSVSKNVDTLLLRFCKRKGLCCRTLVAAPEQCRETKVGAFVHTPKPGLYDSIYESDFASLYPSIIQTFNIGPNTLVGFFQNRIQDVIDYLSGKDKEYVIVMDPNLNPTPTSMNYQQVKEFLSNYILAFHGGVFKKHEDELSILSDVIAYLKKERKHHKKLLKETGDRKHDNIQRAFKEQVNGLYGYLGFDASRFNNPVYVNNVTLSGQMINKISSLTYQTCIDKDNPDITQEEFKNIINELTNKYWNTDLSDKPNIKYGDTDSIFVLIDKFDNQEENINFGNQITDTINNKVLSKYMASLMNYSSDNCHLFLEFETFARVYLTPEKKRYALYDLLKDELKITGIETQRSDYPSFTREKLTEILRMLIVDKKPLDEIYKFVDEIREQITQKALKFDTTVGKPVSFSKSLSGYKSVPSPIIGMFLWNFFIMREDFRVGSRGYTFKINPIKEPFILQKISQITGKNLKQVDWITIPEQSTEQERQKVLEACRRIGGILDSRHWIDFAWDSRVEILLSGIIRKSTVQTPTFDF